MTLDPRHADPLVTLSSEAPPESWHVIVNPHAGSLRNGHLDPEALVEAAGDRRQISFTRDLAHLDEVVLRLRDQRVRTVAILGGDGTISKVLSALGAAFDEDDHPDVFLLGGGSVNALMGELGIAASPLARLRRLRQRIVSGRTDPEVLERNTLSVNGVVGFTFGAGYLQRASTFYERHEVHGRWTSLRVSLRILLGLIVRERAFVAFFDRLPATVRYDGGGPGLAPFNLAYLSTIRDNGLGLMVTPSASDAVAGFESVLARVTVGEYLAAFARMVAGGTMSAPVLERRIVRSVRFELEEPTPWFMDGEHFAPASVITVELGKRLRFLA